MKVDVWCPVHKTFEGVSGPLSVEFGACPSELEAARVETVEAVQQQEGNQQ